MTSTNVWNLMQVNQNSAMTAVGISQESQDKELDTLATFSTLMNQAVSQITTTVNRTQSSMQNQTQTGNVAEASDTNVAEDTAYSKTEYDRYQYKDNQIDHASDTSPEDKAMDSAEDIETFEADVLSAVSDELQVEVEEVIAVLESLGLTPVDLMTPENLVEVCKELTGITDTAQLLTDTQFQAVFQDVTELTDELTKTLDMDVPEIQAAADFIKNQPDFAKELDMAEGRMAVTGMEPVDELPKEMQDAFSKVALTGDASEEAYDPTQTAVTDQEGSVLAEGLAPAEEGEPLMQAEEPMRYEAVKAEERPVETKVRPAEKEADSTENAEVEGPKLKVTMDAESAGKSKSETGGQTASGGQSEGMVLTNADANVVPEASVEIPQTFSYTSVDTQTIIDQIVEQVHLNATEEATSLEMQLNPESLGKLYLNISSKEGSVSAQIFAQNETVKEALEAQMLVLKENLTQAGVKVDAIEVSVEAHAFERNLEQDSKRQEDEGAYQEEKASRPMARRNINLSSLDELAGLMSEEEALVAQMMRDNGNSVDLSA